jgi:hypothetical protein
MRIMYVIPRIFIMPILYYKESCCAAKSEKKHPLWL